MVTLAVFAAGLICGVWLGVFSLVVFGAVVCVAALVADWSGGGLGACAHAMEMWAVLIVGFLVALTGVCLTPEPETPGQARTTKKWALLFREKRAKTGIF